VRGRLSALHHSYLQYRVILLLKMCNKQLWGTHS